MYLFSAYALHYVFYVCVCVYDLYLMCVCAQARVQGGGAQGAWPPLEIKKQKKKKKVIRANFKLFHLYFATILVENIIFSPIF